MHAYCFFYNLLWDLLQNGAIKKKKKTQSQKVKNKTVNLSGSPDITDKVLIFYYWCFSLDFWGARSNKKQKYISFHKNFHDFATRSCKTNSWMSPTIHKVFTKDVDKSKCSHWVFSLSMYMESQSLLLLCNTTVLSLLEGKHWSQMWVLHGQQQDWVLQQHPIQIHKQHRNMSYKLHT